LYAIAFVINRVYHKNEKAIVKKSGGTHMRIIIVRHGDPNYELDTLTKTGWREAELAAEYLSKLQVKAFYVSPLGRAQDTAGCTLKKMNRTAETLDWLREFEAHIDRPDVKNEKSICWDWLPQDMEKDLDLYDRERWNKTDIMRKGNVEEAYRWVCDGLDALLKKHGYERDDMYYRVNEPNHDTIVLFCHFGVECVMLSHLLNVSPMVLWHGLCAAPSSITSIYTEERRKGIASFRVNEFGSTAHLYVAGEKPSFAARFCECYGDGDRQD
jgi:broad specificity phosphatase PhoE